MENGNFKSAFGLAASLLAAEHFFSAGMSSPWSVAKFANTPQDQAQVWRLFEESAIGSMISAFTIGYLLKDERAFWFSVLGAGAITAWMGWDYKRAMEGTL